MGKLWLGLVTPLTLATTLGSASARDVDVEEALIRSAVTESFIAMPAPHEPQGVSGAAAAIALLYEGGLSRDVAAAVGAVSGLAEVSASDVVNGAESVAAATEEEEELVALRMWADELADDAMQDLRGAGYNFNFTASFILSDAGIPSFDFAASALPDNVVGTPSMTQVGSGTVQVSAQVAQLSGFNGIGTFVAVNGSYNVTTTTTNVNIIYLPNVANQSVNTLIGSFMSAP